VTKRADLLKRIKKCLALAKSGNEHEAAAALAKAREMMDEYAVSAEEIELADVLEAPVKGSGAQRPALWENILCATVRRALCVDVVLSGSERIYIGRGAAPEIATYAFAVLFRQLKSARQAYVRSVLKRCGPARKRQRADVFCQAWASAVFSKIAALMPKAELDPLIGKYIEKRFGELGEVQSRQASNKGRRTDGDYWAGRDAGSTVELSQGLGGSASAPALIGHG